jgi:hypothetical protein
VSCGLDLVLASFQSFHESNSPVRPIATANGRSVCSTLTVPVPVPGSELET